MLERRRFLEFAALAAMAAPAAGRAPARPPAFDPATADASAMALALSRGEVRPQQLVETALARLELVNPVLNAARHVYAAKAREQAAALAAASRARPRLGGVPTFTKDLAEEPGRAFTEGSRAFAERTGSRADGAAAALAAAGLVSLGRSTTPEFGLLPTTEPLLGGPTRNPWSLAHSCGGSSGGAGALVAAGVVPFAHASDGGGSIRIPASANGLVGLKPSRGRMAGEEGAKGVTAVTVNGCVSRSVRDTAAWLAAMESRSGPFRPVGLVTTTAARGLRIGLRAEGHAGAPHPDVMAVFDSTVGLLKRLGHRPVDAPMPYAPEPTVEAFLHVWSLGAAADAGRVQAALGRPPDSDALEPATRAFAARGQAATPQATAGAVGVLEEATRAYVGQFDAFDVLMTPVLGTPPPELGWLAPTVPFETLLDRVLRFVSYTPIENAAGVPAIALPMGMSAGGLPIGLQFTAPPGGERRLLELAYGIEAARPWARLRPAVWAQ